MATRLYPFQPPSLAFPAGRAPGFDQSHIAAQGISNGYGFSAVASGKTYINLLSGGPFTTPSQFPAAATISGLGPCGLFTTTAQVCAIGANQSTATPPGITVGAIVQFAGTGDGTFCAVIGVNSGHASQFGMAGSSKNLYFYNNAASTSSFTIATGVPYFIAASMQPSSTVNFVAVNLQTGQLLSSTTTTGASLAALSALPQIGLDLGDSHTADAYIAAAMLAPSFMSLQALITWAADPWSFWYPQLAAPQFKVGIPKYVQRAPVETRYVRRDTLDVSLRSQSDVFEFNINLLGIQPLASQNRNYDFPNPRGPDRVVDLLSWIQPINNPLIGGVTPPPRFYDWIVPQHHQRYIDARSIDLRTWVWPFNPNLKETGFGHPQYDWPVPSRGVIPAIDLRTWIQQGNYFQLKSGAPPTLAFSNEFAMFLADTQDFSALLCLASDSPSGQDWSGAGYMSKYEIDTELELKGVFLDALANVPIDPTSVFLYVKDPTGTITTYSGAQITRDNTGRYHLTLTPSISGLWVYKWQGTGVAVATSPDTTFTINPSALIAG